MSAAVQEIARHLYQAKFKGLHYWYSNRHSIISKKYITALHGVFLLSAQSLAVSVLDKLIQLVCVVQCFVTLLILVKIFVIRRISLYNVKLWVIFNHAPLWVRYMCPTSDHLCKGGVNSSLS